MGKICPANDSVSCKSVNSKILRRLPNALAGQTALLPVRSAMLAIASVAFFATAFSTSAQFLEPHGYHVSTPSPITVGSTIKGEDSDGTSFAGSGIYIYSPNGATVNISGIGSVVAGQSTNPALNGYGVLVDSSNVMLSVDGRGTILGGVMMRDSDNSSLVNSATIVGDVTLNGNNGLIQNSGDLDGRIYTWGDGNTVRNNGSLGAGGIIVVGNQNYIEARSKTDSNGFVPSGANNLIVEGSRNTVDINYAEMASITNYGMIGPDNSLKLVALADDPSLSLNLTNLQTAHISSTSNLPDGRTESVLTLKGNSTARTSSSVPYDFDFTRSEVVVSDFNKMDRNLKLTDTSLTTKPSSEATWIGLLTTDDKSVLTHDSAAKLTLDLNSGMPTSGFSTINVNRGELALKTGVLLPNKPGTIANGAWLSVETAFGNRELGTTLSGGGNLNIQQAYGSKFTISADQHYTGMTNVNGGILNLNDAFLSSGSVSLERATLTGNGSIAGTVGTFTGTVINAKVENDAPSLTLGGLIIRDSNLNFELGGAGKTSATQGQPSRIKVNGDFLTFGYNSVSFSDTDLSQMLGLYKLVEADYTVISNPLLFDSTVFGGKHAELKQINSDLYLQVGTVSNDNSIQYWTGQNAWNNSDQTWKNAGGDFTYTWGGKTAVFADVTGINNKRIALNDTISANGLSFLSDGFRIEGPEQLSLKASSTPNSKINVETGSATIAADISSTVALDKTGDGILSLEGNNSIPHVNLYGGTVALNSQQALNSLGYINFDGGDLKVGDGSFSGSATAYGYFTSPTAKIDVAAGIDYTINAVNSAGNIVKDGAGTLNLNKGIFNYDAFQNITVKDGTLKTSTDLLNNRPVSTGGNLVIENSADATYYGSVNSTRNDRTGKFGVVTKNDTTNLEYEGFSTAKWIVSQGTLTTGSSNHLGDIENNANLVLRDNTGTTHFGVITGTGNVSFAADDNLRLYGTYGFTGAATVSKGSVTLGEYASLASTSGLTMLGGTQLNANNATLSNLTLKSGSSLHSNNTSSVLRINEDMTAEAGSTLNFAVGAPSTNTRIRVLGDLDINDVALNITQSGNPADGIFGLGYYRLIDYNGSYSGSGFSSLTIPPLNTAATKAELEFGTGTVDLVVTKDGDNSLQHWTGGNGNWSDVNWLNQGGTTPDLWGGQIAIFKDTPSTIGGVINVDGNQSFSGLQFVDNGYTLDGTGSLVLGPGGSEIRVLADSAIINTQISGSGSLLKTEAGTLVLNGINSYAGGTTIYAGDVQISSDANLGIASGGINLKGGTLIVASRMATNRQIDIDQRGTLNVTDGNLLFALGEISGNGDLLKDGNGTLVLSGANTFKGDIGIKKGSLEIANDASLGDASNDVAFLGGVLATTGSFSTSRDFHLNANGGFNVAGSTQLTVNGNVVGSNVLVKGGAGALVLNGTNVFNGLDIMEGVVIGDTKSLSGDIRNSGTLVFNQATDGVYGYNIHGLQTTNGQAVKGGLGTLGLAGYSSLNWDVQNGALVADANKFTGNAALAANTSLTFEQAKDGYYAGTISGAGSLIKTGSAALTLAGNNTYEGGTVLKGGTLEITSDASLGAKTGSVTFDGGKLLADASFSSDRAYNFLGLGFVNVSDGNNLTLSGALSGRELLKEGKGTLTLNGANSYSHTVVKEGSVIGNSASISGDILNAGTVTFNIAGNETYSGNIQGVNATNGSMIKDGAGSLTLGGISMLDWTINQGQLIVDANKYGGDINIGTHGTAVFNQAANGTLAGTLSGTGTFVKDGAGTLFITGDYSSFDGLVKIASGGVNTGTAGKLGMLGGSMIVDNGAVLSGVGTIGRGASSMITVADGGILAPGNSIGTLTVNGNLVLESGSIYNVETDPLSTDSDRVKVTGDATINGGTVAHIGFAGDYALNTKYTILQADGKLSGSFGNVTSEFAFLNPTLLYDYNAGSVQLELARNGVQFISKGTTPNHLAVANAIDGMGASSSVYDAFVKLPDNKIVIANALDSLSGEIYGSTTSALIEESSYVRDIVNNRMRFALGGIVMDDGMSSQQIDHNWNAWAQAYGGWNKIDGNGNYADVKHSTGGFLVGADTIAENGWLIGAFAGYSDSSIKAENRGASASVDSFHVGAYAAKEWDNNVALRLGVANSWHKVDTQRTASFLGFGPENLTSDANARTFQAFGEVAYKIETKKVTFEPYVNAAYVNHHMGGYNEEGGSAVLKGSKSKSSAVFGTVGVRAKTEVKLGKKTKATVSAGVGYRRASNGVRGAASHGFTGSDEFTIHGAPIAKDALILEAGVDIPVSKKSNFNLNYQAQISSRSASHTVGARFVIKF